MTELSKLEQEKAKAFENRGGSAKEMREINAKIVAKICRKYIEKAYSEGWESYSRLEYKDQNLTQWIKDNL